MRKFKLMIGSMIWMTDFPEKFISKNGWTKIKDPKAILIEKIPKSFQGKTAQEIANWFDKENPNNSKWIWE